jgi:hypothetical protein
MDEEFSKFSRYMHRHQFIVFISGVIVLAFLLVTVALTLYVSSGTAQLDLSRPGYEKIRTQVRSDESFKGFSSSGTLDDASLKQFESLYDQRLKEIESVDAFGNDVLSPKSLQIDQQPAAE